MKINPDKNISVVAPSDQTAARGARRTDTTARPREADAASLGNPAESRFRAVDRTISEVLDRVSLFQVADEAHGKIEDALLRMKEIAHQGSDSSLEVADRESLQFEMDDLSDLVTFLSSNTRYGNSPIFGDNASAAVLWSDAAKSLDASAPHEDNGKVAGVADIDRRSLGIDGVNVATAADSAESLAKLDSAAEKISGNRTLLGSGISRLGDAAREMAMSVSGIFSIRGGSVDAGGAQSALDSANRSIMGAPMAALAAHDDLLVLAE